jgi:acyl-CoA thioesterase
LTGAAPAGPGDEEQRRAERLVGTMLARDAFTAWLGAELVAIGPGACTLRMTVRAEMLNGFGVCHGGITFSLADSALAFASNTHGTVTVSVENSITYPAPAGPGDTLTATATEESAGARLAFYRVAVSKDDGTIVGLFRGTVYRTSRMLGS